MPPRNHRHPQKNPDKVLCAQLAKHHRPTVKSGFPKVAIDHEAVERADLHTNYCKYESFIENIPPFAPKTAITTMPIITIIRTVARRISLEKEVILVITEARPFIHALRDGASN